MSMDERQVVDDLMAAFGLSPDDASRIASALVLEAAVYPEQVEKALSKDIQIADELVECVANAYSEYRELGGDDRIFFAEMTRMLYINQIPRSVAYGTIAEAGKQISALRKENDELKAKVSSSEE